jgi:proline dehydrogenase
MLGEGARTDADALHYLESYKNAIKETIATQARTDCLPRSMTVFRSN